MSWRWSLEVKYFFYSLKNGCIFEAWWGKTHTHKVSRGSSSQPSSFSWIVCFFKLTSRCTFPWSTWSFSPVAHLQFLTCFILISLEFIKLFFHFEEASGYAKPAFGILGDVINLSFEVPQGFAYQAGKQLLVQHFSGWRVTRFLSQAGQYILLGWKGEWHPFTLTSAPEEQTQNLPVKMKQHSLRLKFNP